MTSLPQHQQLSESLFRKITQFVYDYARINLTENKRELVRARLGKLIRQKGMRGYRDFYEYMINDTSGRAVEELMNAISTNLTSFFREPKHFDFLSGTFLPQLAQTAPAGRLRAWSAGCSSGEEAYSIAITLLESFPHTSGWDIKILATDIDTNVLAQAAQGVYEKVRFEAMPFQVLHKHFKRGEGATKHLYRAKPELRRLIAFRHLNLMSPWPFQGRFDFIFCRNVMIYFDRSTQELLVNKFHEVLNPGGCLFIGHSEGLSGVKHSFKYVQPTIYKKVSGS